MVDYQDSSQLHNWLFGTDYELYSCRARANYEARKFLLDVSVLRNNGKIKRNSTNDKNIHDGGTSNIFPTGSTVDNTSTNSPGQQSSTGRDENSTIPTVPPISHFACIPSDRKETVQQQQQLIDGSDGDNDSNHGWYDVNGPLEDVNGKKFLNVKQECVILNFYVSKLGSIIGPNANIPRLRRESKVLATAALLLKRFYLSNSVMLFDPKTIMVAAAFLASKVEDVTADIRNIEEATKEINSPISIQQIVQAENYLLSGIHFYLLCFHPYKALLALTEDLRTFLKSSVGREIVTTSTPISSDVTNTDITKPNPIITGQDLKPIYDTARAQLDDIIISDLPLLYTPGQIGLASLIASQEIVLDLFSQTTGADGHSNTGTQQPSVSQSPPKIDIMTYVKLRFPKGHDNTSSSKSIEKNNRIETDNDDDPYPWLPECLKVLTSRIRQLKDGLYGCGYYMTDISELKKTHKKLKKVRFWSMVEDTDGGVGDDKNDGADDNNNGNNDNDDTVKRKKKKDKKKKDSVAKNDSQNATTNDDNANVSNITDNNSPPTKRVKLE
jgi:Cyclin, N-terminal domain/Cyclin C-terminal domain